MSEVSKVNDSNVPLNQDKNASCDVEDLPIEPRETTWSWFRNLWWNRPPPEILEGIEENIIQRCKTPSKGWYVDVPAYVFDNQQGCCKRGKRPCRIWTRKFDKVSLDGDDPQNNSSRQRLPKLRNGIGGQHNLDKYKAANNYPLVMVHGLGAGGALFALSFEELAKHFTVYCIDLPGFARSSRCKLSTDPNRCEEQMISLLEGWRQKVGLQRMNLLGHSFGGYICGSYALKYPQRINHLVLADPWGFTPYPPEMDNGQYVSPSGRTISWWFVLLFKAYSWFNPLALFRLGGRYTLGLIRRRRQDICQPFNILWEKEEDNVSADYLHQANLHTPTGEAAFCTLAHYFFWAKVPFVNRINELDPNIPLTAIYGGNSWMPSLTREEFEAARNGEGYCRVRTIDDVGHHVYSKFEEFSYFVINACQVCNVTDLTSE